MNKIRIFFSTIYNLLLSPFILLLLIAALFTKYIYVSQAISIIPFSFGMKIRRNFYRLTLAKCGKEVAFGFGTIVSYKDIEIGNRVRLGPYNTLGHVIMGDDIITAQYVHFLSGSKQHGYKDLNVPMNIQTGVLKTIEIGNDIWIGCNVVVMDSIANGCIIGSGSVITKPVSNYNIVAGNPARIIKKRE